MMSYGKIGKWGKQRLKGVIGVLELVEKEMNEQVLNDLKLAKKEIPEVTAIANIVIGYKTKALQTVRNLEAAITESMIG